eukprot:EG_transcript_46390
MDRTQLLQAVRPLVAAMALPELRERMLAAPDGSTEALMQLTDDQQRRTLRELGYDPQAAMGVLTSAGRVYKRDAEVMRAIVALADAEEAVLTGVQRERGVAGPQPPAGFDP